MSETALELMTFIEFYAYYDPDKNRLGYLFLQNIL